MTSPATNSSPAEKRRVREKRLRPAVAPITKTAGATNSRRSPAGGVTRSSRRTDCGRATLRRVLFIHGRLGNGYRIDAAAVARSLEVSARTIKRDLEFMRDWARPSSGRPVNAQPSAAPLKLFRGVHRRFAGESASRCFGARGQWDNRERRRYAGFR
jgi:hypothetical protein